MDKTMLNYLIDVGLAISFFICFITGMIKWPGIIKVIGVSAYQVLHVHNISTLHDMSGLIMSLLVLIHLALHWKWMVCVTRRILNKE